MESQEQMNNLQYDDLNSKILTLVGVVQSLWVQSAAAHLMLEYVIKKMEEDNKLDKKDLDDFMNKEMEAVKSRIALELFQGTQN